MAAGDIETYFDDADNLWKNRVQGNQRASSTHVTKDEAVAAGRRRAIADGVEHFIKNKDGRIGERNTYPRSRDPRSSKG